MSGQYMRYLMKHKGTDGFTTYEVYFGEREKKRAIEAAARWEGIVLDTWSEGFSKKIIYWTEGY